MESGVGGGDAVGEVVDEAGEAGWARRAVRDVPDAGFVLAGVAGTEAGPVEDAEDAPDGDGADVDAIGEGGFGGLPDVVEPADLLVGGGAEVGFGDGDGEAVALPGFAEHGSGAGEIGGDDADGFDVDEGIAAGVAAGEAWGVELGALVEKAVAGDVVVEAEDGRGTGVFGEPEHVCFGEAVLEEEVPERVVGVDVAAEEIYAEPAAGGVGLRGLAEGGGCGDGAAIFGVDEAGFGDDAPDGSHGEGNAADLVGEGVEVAAHVAVVRVPVAVEAGEAAGGLGLVDGGPIVDPGVAPGYDGGELSKFFGEVWVQEVGGAGAAAVVDEGDDGPDAKALHGAEHAVGEVPAAGCGEGFPEDTDAKGADSEGGNVFEVGFAAIAEA